MTKGYGLFPLDNLLALFPSAACTVGHGRWITRVGSIVSLAESCSEPSRIAVNRTSAEKGQQNLGLVDLAGRNRKQVVIKDDEVRILAYLDRAGRLLQAIRIGGVDGEGGQGFRKIDALARQERRMRLSLWPHARDRDLNLLQRIRARDVPVAAECDDRAAAIDGADRVQARSALRAQERDGELGDVIIRVCPQRLEVRDDAELAEARYVRRIDQLEMRDVIAMSEIPVAAPGCLDGIQRFAHGPVSDRVEVHLETRGVEKRDGFLEEFRIDHGDPAHVAGLLEVGLQEHAGVVLKHPVLHDLDGARIYQRRRVLTAQPLDPVDLLQALRVLPPDCGNYPHGELMATL